MSNKSFVGLTHVAYGIGPVTLTIRWDSYYFPDPLAFGHDNGN